MTWNPRDIPIERPSSFDETGKRVRLYPAKVKGKYKNQRNIFYFFLLFVFLVVPWTTFQGEQTLLFDIARRRFVFFGTVFSAHDGPLIFFPLILATLGLGFVTSVWGRVWCGWACPQTVFLESLFRRIDQWVEGPQAKRMKLDKQPWTLNKVARKSLKWFLFLLVCSHIAHSFTAYFVGAKNLFWLTTSPPTDHLSLFIFIQVLTIILLFNFGWFREQFCIIMCPYGRFQSVLMGKKSLAILYNEKRGEPRKVGRDKDHGDCVNCYRCVSVCPMGIDIRRGVQMECIACTACIDACDEIMDKVGKPKGLVSYSSISKMESNEKKKLGSRSLAYLLLILAITVSFVFILAKRSTIDLKIIRAIEAPYTVTGEMLINHFRLVIKNQGQFPMLIESPDVGYGTIVSPGLPATVAVGEIKRVHIFLKFNQAEQRNLKESLEIHLKIRQGEEELNVVEKVKILRP